MPKSPVAPEPPSDRPSEGQLDSWKEIAAYVKRDVSTVQRWEKREGMPVHRHVHDKRGSVYAFQSELDAWLASRRRTLEGEGREEGVESRAVEADVDGRGGERGFRWLVRGAAAVAVIAFVAVYVETRGGPDTMARPKIDSLAVLPLKNLSGDPSQEYFADGMTEAVIGRLSMIRGLRVISRTSVMPLKDTRLSIPEIAKMLHVDALVEGSVIREKGRVRVYAQLIRGATDDHIWSETYDAELGDALALESEVAQSIARRVEVTVT